MGFRLLCSTKEGETSCVSGQQLHVEADGWGKSHFCSLLGLKIFFFFGHLIIFEGGLRIASLQNTNIQIWGGEGVIKQTAATILFGSLW